MSTFTCTPVNALQFTPTFCIEGDPLDSVTWTSGDVRLEHSSSKTVSFEQRSVEAPAEWSQTARLIAASKYFHGKVGTPERESSVKQLFTRVVDSIVSWGAADGYFASPEDAKAYRDDLLWLLLHQHVCFNSPVLFNTRAFVEGEHSSTRSYFWDGSRISSGYEGSRRPQVSACFINSCRDSMESILNLAKTEGMLFKHGSGAGSNLSDIRAANESLAGGGSASGPVSFMRGFDSFAGAIKSGGKTRRAAKMVILNADHPDIEDFIGCKGNEEAKAKILIANGYDGSTPDSEAYASVAFQNANHSVRLTDEFMKQAVGDAPGPWALTARADGSVVRTVEARDLLRKIAEETWKCGDPGVQFDTTINHWNPVKESGRINASNPCSEFFFLDDSACNLASFNLVKFLGPNGTFNTLPFLAAVRIMIVAMDILVDHGGYPTELIAQNSHDFRPLGLGYANLGTLMMMQGLPYDSDEGRNYAAAITAIMGGEAYCASAELAGALSTPVKPADPALVNESASGAFPAYSLNKECVKKVVQRHRDAAFSLKETTGGLERVAWSLWTQAVGMIENNGCRNAQVTLLAPTGTIGYLMDCSTTGVEPLLGLSTVKKLVGGGSLTSNYSALSTTLTSLDYTPEAIDSLIAWVDKNGTFEGANHLKPEHLAIFDCALKPQHGSRSISWQGHLKMMAAVQPFLSGGISKTVNMPLESSVEDVMEVYIQAWREGLKSVAIYRDGSKGGQPIELKQKNTPQPAQVAPPEITAPAEPLGPPPAVRNRMPDERASITHKFSIAGHEGYVTVGLYPNGKPGEIFIRIAKEGSTISGLMDSFAQSVSMGLQHGVPIESFVKHFAHMRFEPSGWTGNQSIGFAKSIPDYIFRWMNMRFRQGTQLAMFPDAAPATDPIEDHTITQEIESDAPSCPECGSHMQRSGTHCWKCSTCGTVDGGCS